MMDSAGVKYTQLRPTMKALTLDFTPPEAK